MDSLNLYSSVKSLPDQCQQAFLEISQQAIPPACSLVDNIVVSGMGGSALGGRVLAALDRQVLKIPLVVSTDYHLPNFVNHKTLVIVSSYSGNTQESVNSLTEAIVRGAQIFIITTGGKLAQSAVDHHLPAYIFKPNFNPSSQPRMAIGYNIIAIISVLSRCGLIHPQKDISDLKSFLTSKQSLESDYQDFAGFISGKIPVLVSSEHLRGAVHCFKNQLNENAKNFSVAFDIPELNHHLMEGLAYPKTNSQDLVFILFSSGHYHPDVKNRYRLTSDVITKNHIPVRQYSLSASSRFFEVMELIQAGGYISYHLSQLNGVDPGPIPWVDYFKESL